MIVKTAVEQSADMLRTIIIRLRRTCFVPRPIDKILAKVTLVGLWYLPKTERLFKLVSCHGVSSSVSVPMTRQKYISRRYNRILTYIGCVHFDISRSTGIGCAPGDFPGVYARVSRYVSLILS